jgi:magnesium transporter
MSDSNFFHISPTGALTSLPNLAEALAMRKEGGYIWLNYSQPSKEALTALIEPLGLHPLSIEDCLDESQIPKIEDYTKHTFLIFNAYKYKRDDLAIYEIDMFVGDDFLITVAPYDEQGKPLLNNLEHFVDRDGENAGLGPAFLAHVILDFVVDQKFIAIEALEEQINNTEDQIMISPGEYDPSDLLQLRRDLLKLRKSLFHEREILVKISRKDCRFIPEKALFYYRDIYDHLTKFFELTESSRDIVTSLMEMYLSMLNNQMAKSANETNATVRRLTFITTIFMPLSLLAGIGGMSEWSMMTGPENWRIAYPLFLLAMAILGFSTYFLLTWSEKRRRQSGKSGD